MTEDSKGDAKPAAKSKTERDVITNADGSPVVDFASYADAAAQADALGGTVDAIRTAYHVSEAS